MPCLCRAGWHAVRDRSGGESNETQRNGGRDARLEETRPCFLSSELSVAEVRVGVGGEGGRSWLWAWRGERWAMSR
jgi:hypothetical protein